MGKSLQPVSADYSRSLKLLARSRMSIAGGVNSAFRVSTSPTPLFFRHAEGARLYDVDGNEYIDYVLGMGPVILGHQEPGVTEAVARALLRGQLFAGQHEAEVDLAERLVAHVPSAELVRLGQSGSEMVHAALRTARAATARNVVIKFEGHYHGWFDPVFGGVAAGHSEPPDVRPQSAGQPAASLSEMRVLPWNDFDAITDFMALHGTSVAAIIAEPILCNTSVIPPEPGYLELLRALSDEHGTVLVFDEVVTGFRVGLGGAQSRLGVTPDLTILAKALGNGFPIAALVGREWAMRPIADGSALHGGTYNANVTSVAAALATVDRLAQNDGDAYRAMERCGMRLMEGLRRLGEQHRVPFRVQGLPTVFNTTFAPPEGRIRDAREYAGTDLSRQARLLRLLLDRGIRVTARGTWFLSTKHTDVEVDGTLSAVDDALSELEDTQ